MLRTARDLPLSTHVRNKIDEVVRLLRVEVEAHGSEDWALVCRRVFRLVLLNIGTTGRRPLAGRMAICISAWRSQSAGCSSKKAIDGDSFLGFVIGRCPRNSPGPTGDKRSPRLRALRSSRVVGTHPKCRRFQQDQVRLTRCAFTS